MKPSTNPADIARALQCLLRSLQSSDAEFPDVAWRVASGGGVDYTALCDAYDEYCASKAD